jgi:hypothetical protein
MSDMMLFSIRAWSFPASVLRHSVHPVRRIAAAFPESTRLNTQPERE